MASLLTALSFIKLAALVSFVSASMLQAEVNPQLSVWIETPRVQFKFCERIPVFMFVENVGTLRTSIPYVDESCVAVPNKLSMRLADADGWLDRANIECHESFPYDSIDLAPGDTVMFAFSLLGIFGRGGRQTKYPPCIPPGNYRIEAEYMGNFVAEPCHFSVVPLTADEEGQILPFTSVWNSQLKGKHRYAAYVDVYSKLKGTPFESFACEMIISQPASYEPSPERRQHFAQEYLVNFPNERRTDRALAVLMKHAERNKLLESLSAIPSLRQNRFQRHALKNVCRALNDTPLYHEVMK